jgi:hypothetical protein
MYTLQLNWCNYVTYITPRKVTQSWILKKKKVLKYYQLTFVHWSLMPDQKMQNQKFLQIPQQTCKSKTKLKTHVYRETHLIISIFLHQFSLSTCKRQKSGKIKKVTTIYYKPSVYKISLRPNIISNNKIRIFMDVTLYTSADRYQCFKETSCLHLQVEEKQGKRVYDMRKRIPGIWTMSEQIRINGPERECIVVGKEET